jgi:Spy/CpxP family protein refolding chaperone
MSDIKASRKAAIWVAIIFLLGMVLGGMVGYGYAHRAVAAANPPKTAQERRTERVTQLTQELGLTNDQAKQLDAILMQWHAEAKTIHEKSDAQLDELRQKGRNQIRAILTPEQKPKFEEFLTKLDAERKQHAPK